MKVFKIIIGGIIGIILILLATISYYFIKDAQNPYSKVDYAGVKPRFKEVPFRFEHKFNADKSLPMTGSAIIDIDNDGVSEVFIGGGYNQEDGLLKFQNNEFVNIITETGLKKESGTTLGVAVIDLDSNGFSDLIVARNSGVYFYFNEKGKFTEKKIEIPVNQKSSPISFALADLNGDGFVDIYLCTYLHPENMEGQTIFKDKNYGSTNLLLLNNGDNTFTDITKQSGLEYIHNTFQAVFVDVDDDQLVDLIVAHDTGEVRTYKNLGNLKFEIKNNPSTGNYAYPMGIAVGDYNNDGKVDFFFSNTGSTIPSFIARGDTKPEDTFNEKWILFENQGGFQFKDMAKENQVADFEFSWGAVMEDFNLDGKQDLVVAENYVSFLPHEFFKLPGRFLLQSENTKFISMEKELNAENKAFGITPLVSDFNNDGYPDIIYINVSGPSKALISEAGNQNYAKVKLPDSVSSLGAIIKLKTGNGISLTSHFVNGEGLLSDQTHTATFGLGKEDKIQSIEVLYISGKRKIVENPKINTLISID